MFDEIAKALKVDEEDAKLNVVEWIPTGILALDKIIGRPGIPVGRITEILGDVATGKSYLGYSILANTQKKGGVSILVDFESALDPEFAAVTGLDLKRCIVLTPLCLEEFFENVDTVLDISSKNKENFVTVVVDSIAAAPTKAELEGSLSDRQLGDKARLMSLALRRITSKIVHARTALIFINQLREKIGILFGPKWTTPGGLAIPYHASLRIMMTKVSDIKVQSKVVGIRIKLNVIKNKLEAPFQNAEVDLYFDKGVDNEGYLLELLVSKGIIGKSGGWYTYKSKNFHADKFMEILNSNEELKKEVKECLGSCSEIYMQMLLKTSEETPTESH
jgi:recombination protein RecA